MVLQSPPNVLIGIATTLGKLIAAISEVAYSVTIDTEAEKQAYQEEKRENMGG
jgi:hypothetical protein